MDCMESILIDICRKSTRLSRLNGGIGCYKIGDKSLSSMRVEDLKRLI